MESAGDCENIRMKRLFKRITALASAAALTLSLAACGGLSLIHISEPTRRTPISYAVFCLKKKNITKKKTKKPAIIRSKHKRTHKPHA